MGVKSTKYLTRKEAEERYIHLYSQTKLQRKLRVKLAKMDNAKLENKLEELNDTLFNEQFGSGGGFDNYIISETADQQ